MTEKYKKIIDAAKAGGEEAKKYFGKDLDVKIKSMNADFQTKADTNSEAAILEIINKEFPDYNIFAEETGITDRGSEYTFYIDPLDGSNNFVKGVPYYSACIGLVKGKEIVFGVVYDPMLDRVWWAEKGEGAYFNNQKIHVNSVDDMKKATINHNCSYLVDKNEEISIEKKLYELGVRRVIDYWSPALDFCLLASGKIEGVVNDGCEIYDFIAGKVICTEAGGRLTNFKGEEEKDPTNTTFVISNNTKIHEGLLKVANDKRLISFK